MAKPAQPAPANHPEPVDADRAARTLSVDGNRLTFLPDGSERLRQLIALIDGAKQSLRLLYYIFMPDASGAKVREAIIRAIDRGVKVAMLVDGFGSDSCPADYFAELRRKGADFCRFHPSYGRRYLLRNHQKLALADAESTTPLILVGASTLPTIISERSSKVPGATSACSSKGRRRAGSRPILTS